MNAFQSDAHDAGDGERVAQVGEERDRVLAKRYRRPTSTFGLELVKLDARVRTGRAQTNRTVRARAAYAGSD